MAMKMYGEAEVQLHAFLISDRGGDEWLVSRPGQFIPWYPLDKGSLSPRTGMDAEGKEKIHR